MKRILTVITLTLTFALATLAQTGRPLKVYIKGGLVDSVSVNTPNGSIVHSRTDLNGTTHDDYVSVIVTDVEGRARQYLISQVDSLVLPTGRRVVFHGGMMGQPALARSVTPEPGDGRRRTSLSGTFPGTQGTNVVFYWTENDHIRLDVGSESRAAGLSADRTSASFYFGDIDDEAQSYVVYYPDKQVTIPAEQTQTGANNTDHIGPGGDSGTAIATRQAGGSYSFELEHKSAYLCFLPHIDHLPSARIEKIVLTSNYTVSGTYLLAPGGLYGGTQAYSTTLHLQPLREHDFFIGHSYAIEQDSCAAFMVIQPALDNINHAYAVAYHVVDTLSRMRRVFMQYFSFNPQANTVYPVTCHLKDDSFRAVDMGLSVNWSNRNVGADEPSRQGGSYATWAEAEADALRQTAVTEWLMPTAVQQSELLDKCRWNRATYNGTPGWMVTAAAPSTEDGQVHRLFLPAAEGTSPEACLAASHRRPVEALMIDLGLTSGTRWASRNLGAATPGDFGDYIAWGEIWPKSDYRDSNYSGYRNSVWLSFGNNQNISGTDKDAARVRWGGVWHMPDRTEWQELMDECGWEWKTGYASGHNGYLVTGPNGHRIFLPAAGNLRDWDVTASNADVVAQYPTSERSTNYVGYIWAMNCHYNWNSGKPYFGEYWYDQNSYRAYGRVVRAVASAANEAGGLQFNIATDAPLWTFGQQQATIRGTLSTAVPVGEPLTVGFLIGDTPALDMDHYGDRQEWQRTVAGSFSSDMTLWAGLGQWYRAFVIVDGQPYYGEPRHYGFEMVDLGLPSGTKWANMNVGADSETDAGDYFAWGEVEPKDTYTEANYQWRPNGVYQDFSTNISGTQYDAATAQMGAFWRMPTREEFNELVANCDCEHLYYNSVSCWKFTNKADPTKFIYIPIAGQRNGTNTTDASLGIYLEANRIDSYRYNYFLLEDNNNTPHTNNWNYKYLGQSLRAVVNTPETAADGQLYIVSTRDAEWTMTPGESSATLHGTFISSLPIDGTVTVGFVVGDGAAITKDDCNSMTAHEMGLEGAFSDEVSVYDNIGQWYRAYLKVGDTYYYGEAKQYGVVMVDLGLPSGALWANMNVGATSPTDRGNYYAWGETRPKDTYTLANYAFYKDGAYIDITPDISGTDYDAATVNMGTLWATPTEAQYNELKANCTTEGVLIDNMWCTKFKSKTNSNYIIVPCVGERLDGNNNYNYNSWGYYMLSTRYEYHRNRYFYVNSGGGTSLEWNYKYYGQPVRPVVNKTNDDHDGIRVNVVTNDTEWQNGQEEVTLHGRFFTSAPMGETVTLGFMLSDDADIDDAHHDRVLTAEKRADGSFSATVTDIYDNQGQWYRAFAKVGDAYYYGEVRQYGVIMVDLGLPSGTKWANVNVGASLPIERGNYYAWGETQPKDSYTLANYAFYKNGAYIDIAEDISGTLYDAASVNMGMQWATPTADQYNELKANCTTEGVLINNMWCTKFKSKTSGNYIIVPCVGEQFDGYTSGYNYNSWGYYMLSTRYEYHRNRYFYVNSGGGTSLEWNWKYYGQPVRAVTNKRNENVDGELKNVFTHPASWAWDQSTVTLRGTFASSERVAEDVTVGFIIGDSVNIDINHLRFNREVKTVRDTCSFSTEVALYDNYGQWYRAYARVGGIYYYGDVHQYGLQMVDLGLPSGTLWANMNVGADSPEQFGDYFAWGETEKKDSYTDGGYEFYDGAWHDVSVEGSISGTPYDAAMAQMGALWCMPTEAQWAELRDNCTWGSAVLIENRWCRKVMSKKNGNYILMPIYGGYYANGLNLYDTGNSYYHTATVYDDSRERGVYINGGGTLGIHNISKSIGQTVRAVAVPKQREADGAYYNTATYDNEWTYGDATVTLCGAFKSSEPVSGDVTVGFLLCDDPTAVKGQEVEDVVAAVVADTCSFSKAVAVTNNIGHWYRAYVKLTDGTYRYGNACQYGIVQVDLGLPSGTKWASINVGASRPEQFGNYYAWGEYEPKAAYSNDTYREDLLNKDLGVNIAGTTYDTALRVWGDNWCMPTETQFVELYNTAYCDRSFVRYKGIYCYKFKSKSNGSYLYLPIAGEMSGATYYNSNWWAFYWTSTYDSSSPTARARRTNFYGQNYYYMERDGRYLGLPVRAVRSR